MSFDEGFAGRRCHVAGQDFHRGRFSRSVWTEKGDDLPLWNLEADVANGRERTVELAEIFCLYGRRGIRHDVPPKAVALVQDDVVER